MSNIHTRIESLEKLKIWIDDFLNFHSEKVPADYTKLHAIIENNHIYNPWFVKEFCLQALSDFKNILQSEKIEKFAEIVKPISEKKTGKQIVILPSQNVMFSGSLEFLILYLAGFDIILRNTNHNDDLFHYCLEKLISIESGNAYSIKLTNAYPRNIDGWVIHDKPGHTALHNYFDQRNTIFIPRTEKFVIIQGLENEWQLREITDRIFIYWGLHPDNIRKIYVPVGYNFDVLFRAFERYSYLYQYNCYANNYDYHRSVLLMNRVPFFENGFIILKEDTSFDVPIGCLYFEYYSNEDNILFLKDKEKQNFDGTNEKIATMLSNFMDSI